MCGGTHRCAWKLNGGLDYEKIYNAIPLLQSGDFDRLFRMI